MKMFLNDIKKLYRGKAVSTSFQNSTEAKKEINDYVKNKTRGNINQILEDLDPNALMVIVNYIYFKGKLHRCSLLHLFCAVSPEVKQVHQVIFE